MKRARREESNVWPNKKVVNASSNANASWPLATQPSVRRGSNSYFLGNRPPVSADATFAAAASLPAPDSSLPSAKPIGLASLDAPLNAAIGPANKMDVAKSEDTKPRHIPKAAMQRKMAPRDTRKNPPCAFSVEETESLLSPSSSRRQGDLKAINGDKGEMPPPKSKVVETRNIPGALSFMVAQDDELGGLDLICNSFHVVSALAVVVWLILMAVAVAVTPEENIVYLDTVERNSALIAAFLMLLVLLAKLAPIFLSRGKIAFRGILVGALAVQFVALGTNIIFVFLKVPIMLDPVTGARVYVFRWCEWTPLAFAMTFFTEGVGVTGKKVPEEYIGNWKAQIMWYWRSLKIPFLFSLSQGLSTFMGFLFPYCTNLETWTVAMVLSCVLYSILFPRLFLKRTNVRKSTAEKSTEELESSQRMDLSYRLLVICTVCWTALVLSYCIGAFSHALAPPESLFGHPSLPFFCDAMMDVTAKAFYMDVIVDVHKLVFDETSRATRRLEELRRMMAVVWEGSSDVIVLSVRNKRNFVTMLSPSFHKVERIVNHYDVTAPIVFEMAASEVSSNVTNGNLESANVYFLDILSGDDVSGRKERLDPIKQPGFLSLRNLVRRGWTISTDEQTIHHDLRLENRSTVSFETKVTRLGPHALVLVMRDISERIKRFEAEKTAISESTARRKDEEANRFTRHEVKNGLLASIGLCDSLREAISEETGKHIDRTTSGSLSSLRLMSMLESNKKEKWRDPLSLHRNVPGQDGVQILVKELDLTLRDILDTVLSEAMARDVIHEVYQPRLERADIQSVLGGETENSVANRFPFVTDPSPLPLFLFDLQLLKFIHRNAVSNACKYGKKGGVVLTEVRHLPATNEIQMDVINLPGENHAKILAMGDAAQTAVFSAGNRLQLNNDLSEGAQSHSSGDGAWISQKCARTLGGTCGIRFEQNRTVFTLRCPVTTFDVALGVPSNFRLPESTWGVAIDDSKIQRKMLQRFFSLAGIPENQQVLLGQSTAEIRGFNQTVLELVKNHPNSYFLLIVDENLDITTPTSSNSTHKELTISGSLTIQKLRKELGVVPEERVLAVVRSANDSAADIEIYNARAHGFLYKAPIQKEKIMEVLAPLWVKRFAKRFPESVDVSTDDNEQVNTKPDIDAATDDYVSAAFDVMETLEVIDALCMEDEAFLAMRWSLIWKKLQALKSELQTLEKSEVVEEALIEISKMNGPKIPDDFLSQWATLRALIIRVV